MKIVHQINLDTLLCMVYRILVDLRLVLVEDVANSALKEYLKVVNIVDRERRRQETLEAPVRLLATVSKDVGLGSRCSCKLRAEEK